MSAAHVDLYRVGGSRTPRYVRVDLMDVRSANTLVIHYDMDRDGWVIEQPIPQMRPVDEFWDEALEEVAFVPAWSESGGAAVDAMNRR